MRYLSRKVVLVVAVIAVAGMAAAAQAPAQKPSFEVASVKANTSNDERVALLTPPGGRIVATNVTLKTLMAVAYRLPESRIFGGPSWLTTDRWNIEAKAEEGSIAAAAGPPDPTVTPTLMLMTQSVIEDRFQLKSHREMRELPIYELFVAQGGLKMKLSEDQGPTSATTLPQEGRPTPRGFLKMGVGEIEANGIPFANFIAGLAQELHRPVIDKTGLKGLYDIKLQWTHDPGLSAPVSVGAIPTAPFDVTGPSIFAALTGQLGLRLESAKGPAEVLMIDSVQKPSEN